MYTNEVKQLFGKKKPTVTCFNTLVKPLSAAEKDMWKEKVFIEAFCSYKDYNKAYRKFFNNFTDSYRQEFLDYLLHKTVLGEKRFPLHEPLDTVQDIAINEKKDKLKGGLKSSLRHLAFICLLAFLFKPERTIDTLCNQMRLG